MRLDDHTPAHHALSQVAAARTVSRFGPGWRPRHPWIQAPADRRRYTLQFSCRMVQGSSSWPLSVDATDLCCLRDLMMMMMTCIGPTLCSIYGNIFDFYSFRRLELTLSCNKTASYLHAPTPNTVLASANHISQCNDFRNEPAKQR